ncbi:acyltransferase [Mycolicibacterium sp. P9-22]|nr:acyltransferase [Mycolicibacterium sp. P9-22]
MRATGDSPVTDRAATNRVASLTGLRALAALLIVATHAAFGTGHLDDGYLGQVYARLEVGVPVFFVLSGFLLFRPWVQATAQGTPDPSVRRYARRRVRRIAPAYVITVLIAFAIYAFRDAGPNPGHSWFGLLKHLTLTQIYPPLYYAEMHQGLTQMWSLAVEVAFYAALPLLAGLLLTVLCRGAWRPGVLLAGLAALGAVTPLWLLLPTVTDLLPPSATIWLPAHLIYFVGGMALAVLQVLGTRCRAYLAVPIAVAALLVVALPIAGDVTVIEVEPWQRVLKTILYAVVAVGLLAPLVLDSGSGYARLLSARPVVWLGEISYEIFLLHVIAMEFAMAEVLHWPTFTGSMPGLFFVTTAMTVPAAWLLHRWTRTPTPTSERSRR